MTVSSTNTKNSYSGNGSTTVFAYTFKIFDDDDITVILRTDATGGEAVQTKTTHYTVSGVGNAGGGNITFGTAPASGITVVLLRETAQTQATDYTPNDPFPAASHEDALDKLTLIIQDQQEELDRAIKVSRTNTITSSEFTVGATDRANRIFAFDSSGDLSVTQEIGTYQGTDATTTTSAYQERDLIKSTTAGQLNNVYICIADSVAGDLLTDTDHFELIIDAVTAATSATNAASSATAAAASETAAAASESAAATSESNAATSESNASTSATNAATSATASAASASAASTSETNAATSATNASTSATAAASSATAAASSATAAAASESAAATSETNAATSATNAATSETNAATSETNAGTSATNAATSATNAETAKTAAEAAQAAAELALDNFDDIYIGAKASDPTLDNDGDALTAGDLYFNTTSNELKYYTGSAWEAISPGISNVVEDTTPQLGGNLDLNNSDITGTGDINITGTVTATSFSGDGSSLTGISTDVVNDTTPQLGGDLDLNSNDITGTGNIDVTGTVTADGLQISGNASNASALSDTVTDFALKFDSATTADYFSNAICFAEGTNVNASIASFDGGSGGAQGLVFGTGASNTERMRIDNGGNLLVGKTAPNVASVGFEAKSDGAHFMTRDGGEPLKINRKTSNGNVVAFAKDGSTVGSISVTGSATAYNTSSDYRLKENVVADWDATTRLKQLNPVRFNFIADADTTVDGFLAHEVQSVVPEAITGTHNEVDDEGNPVYQGIDQSKLVPLLVKTIQELEARIAVLENA